MPDVKYQFKGTEGAWKIHKVFEQPLVSKNDFGIDVWHLSHWIMRESDNKYLGQVHYNTEDSGYPMVKEIPEFESNANLIAAAPDLLEALKVALWHEENGEAEAQKQGRPRLTERLEIYRAAIHKALNL